MFGELPWINRLKRFETGEIERKRPGKEDYVGVGNQRRVLYAQAREHNKRYC
ncbi:hypothetical protein D3C87_1882100 [compost metagenome]